MAAHFTGVDGVNYALDLETGEVLWQTTVGKSLELQEKEDEALKTLGKPTPPRARTSPIITDEAVWLAWDGKLIALHVPTGEVLWSADIEHREIGGLTAHAEWLYYIHPDGIDAWGPPDPLEQPTTLEGDDDADPTPDGNDDADEEEDDAADPAP